MSTPELRTMIVDDEAPAREFLGDLLSAHLHVKIVGEANSVGTAASLYADLRPDLIFLDVQMPDGDGFSLLPKLDPLPAIIFVTAFDAFAIRAFDVNAIDYLLKPVHPDRLAHALERIVHKPPPTNPQQLREDDQIVMKSDSRMHVVFVSQIIGIEAQENYTRIHLANGTTEFLRRTMKEWERMLPITLFLRIDRLLILNLKAVAKVVAEDRDNSLVEVTGFPAPIPLGRKAAMRLRNALRLRNQV